MKFIKLLQELVLAYEKEHTCVRQYGSNIKCTGCDLILQIKRDIVYRLLTEELN